MNLRSRGVRAGLVALAIGVLGTAAYNLPQSITDRETVAQEDRALQQVEQDHILFIDEIHGMNPNSVLPTPILEHIVVTLLRGMDQAFVERDIYSNWQTMFMTNYRTAQEAVEAMEGFSDEQEFPIIAPPGTVRETLRSRLNDGWYGVIAQAIERGEDLVMYANEACYTVDPVAVEYWRNIRTILESIEREGSSNRERRNFSDRLWIVAHSDEKFTPPDTRTFKNWESWDLTPGEYSVISFVDGSDDMSLTSVAVEEDGSRNARSWMDVRANGILSGCDAEINSRTTAYGTMRTNQDMLANLEGALAALEKRYPRYAIF